MSSLSRRSPWMSTGVNLGLIITPMLDMSFQILSFFIMTYHPSTLEANVDGRLVPANAAVRPGASDDLIPDPTSSPDIDLPAALVVAKAVPQGDIERQRTDGQPSQISIKNPEDAQPILIADSDEPLADSFQKLRTRLKVSLAGMAKGNLRLDCGGDMKHQ
jgi:hypothetical protein